MELGKYTKDFLRWAEMFLEEKKPKATTRRSCIYITTNEIYFIYFDKVDGRINILQQEVLKYQEVKELPMLFLTMSRQYELTAVPVYWLLSPEDYQLFLIESLPVPKDEFYNALHWRVRGLISYPVEEMSLDYFMLPAKKASSGNPMVAAVTASMTHLMKTIDLFHYSKMHLKTIYIPELALRNLTAEYEDDEKSTAIIYFFEKTIILNISQQKTLYLTHRINWTNIDNPIKENFEQISLEILRYFDYFQSQWRIPMPSRIFVGSEKDNTDSVSKFLSELLLLNVQPFSLKTSLMEDKKIENKFLLTLGCAFIEEKENVTSGN